MVQQEGSPDSGEAGGPAQSLPLPDLLLQSKGREFTAEAKGHRGSGVVSSFRGDLKFLCSCSSVHPSARAAVRPGLGAPEARDRGRPAGGHVGDRLSHSETLEGKHTRYTTTDTQH